ncbi:MAG: monofunctional biosynthetic peptidoglycan transglycosylase [Plesiomonas sp.]
MMVKFRQWGRTLARILAVGFGLLVALIVAYRFLPVALPSVIVERYVQAYAAGNFAFTVHHDWVSSDQIAPAMKLAVIAAEDQRFVENFGFDWEAIRKAMQHNERRRTVRGGSTITQQTAKNVFLWSDRSWLRKGLEAGITVLLESLWSKDRILTVYLNSIEFGPGIFGVEAAAHYYFHKPARRLSSREAALLAAVLPNPIRYKVQAPSGYVVHRQQWILRQMRQLGGTAMLTDL